jgi:Fic family protein
MSANSDRDIINFLNHSISEDHESAVAPLIQTTLHFIEAQKVKFPNITSQQLAVLASLRTLSSSTLRSEASEEEAARWARANQLLFTILEKNEPLELSDIFAIQGALTGAEAGGLRSQSIYGVGEYLSPEFLVAQLEHFVEKVLKDDSQHPLIQACECYIWLSTLHPFSDANGRTARLICDSVLLRNGYLPVTFKSPIEAQVAMVKDTAKREKGRMILKTLQAISHSYILIERLENKI